MLTIVEIQLLEWQMYVAQESLDQKSRNRTPFSLHRLFRRQVNIDSTDLSTKFRRPVGENGVDGISWVRSIQDQVFTYLPTYDPTFRTKIFGQISIISSTYKGQEVKFMNLH
jgi:hypothetical protein